jgi:hypothetical protein
MITMKRHLPNPANNWCSRCRSRWQSCPWFLNSLPDREDVEGSEDSGNLGFTLFGFAMLFYLGDCALFGDADWSVRGRRCRCGVVWALAVRLFRKERVGRCWDEI